MGGVARLFVRAGERIARTLPGAHALWSGVWLGVLSDGQLAAIDEALYDLRAHYRGKEHNLRGLAPWETEAIGAWFPPAARIMVLGVGGGREVIALRRLGFEAFGWESHPVLVEAAKALVAAVGYPGTVQRVPRDEAPGGSERYDAAILGWGMYMLVHGRERRVALLRRVRERLPPGAPVLLSFFTRSDGEARAASVHRIGRLTRALVGRRPPELGDDLMPNAVHRFTRSEIDAELVASGFRLERYEPMGTGPLASGWAVARRA